MKKFFGFALADSMFVGDCNITRRTLPVDEVRALVAQDVEYTEEEIASATFTFAMYTVA